MDGWRMPPPGHTHAQTSTDGRTGRKHNAVASMATRWATEASKSVIIIIIIMQRQTDGRTPNRLGHVTQPARPT